MAAVSYVLGWKNVFTDVSLTSDQILSFFNLQNKPVYANMSNRRPTRGWTLFLFIRKPELRSTAVHFANAELEGNDIERQAVHIYTVGNLPQTCSACLSFFGVSVMEIAWLIAGIPSNRAPTVPGNPFLHPPVFRCHSTTIEEWRNILSLQ